MHSVLTHLARRGVEAHTTFRNEYQTLDEAYKMPVWGIVLLTVTAVMFFVSMSMIEYTFGRLIPALIMVESPQAVLFEPLPNDDPDATLDSKVEPELLLVKQEPITSSFRKSIRHLRAIGGFRSRFRGFAIFAVYGVTLSWASEWIAVLPIIPRGTAPIFASVLLANLSLAWTHIVISESSDKPWYRRVPSARVWKKVAGPTAFLAIAEQLTILLPAALAIFYGLPQLNHETAKKMSCAEKQMTILKAFSVFLVGIVMAFFVVIPANVTLTRVQASLLADDQETIVPFDRSFGGKVVPEVIGGTGVIGVLDAWKTFEWSSRVRLVKAYFKVFAMQFALSVFFFFALIAQVIMIVGKDNLKKIAERRRNSA